MKSFLVQFPNDDVIFFLSEQFCMGFEIIKKGMVGMFVSTRMAIHRSKFFKDNESITKAS